MDIRQVPGRLEHELVSVYEPDPKVDFFQKESLVCTSV